LSVSVTVILRIAPVVQIICCEKCDYFSQNYIRGAATFAKMKTTVHFLDNSRT